jgi:hypothetical protein
MNKLVKPLFFVGGVYDLILGLVFLAVPYTIFEFIDVVPPNHIGYIQFSAAFLTIFGLMQFEIARSPLASRNLIPYAVLIKIAYCAIVFGHYALGNMPMPWLYFAFADSIFLLAFVWAYMEIGKGESTS